MENIKRSESFPSGFYKLSTKDDICRECSTYDYVTLGKFASALGIEGNDTMSKPEICKAIAERVYRLRKDAASKNISSPLQVVPDDIKIKLASNIPTKDMLNMCQTDKYFRNLCNSRDFWYVAKRLIT